jgi:hypothetical protein
VKRKKRPGHFCRICGVRKPNEAFSGRGHRIHVCKACSRRPEAERRAIEQRDEVFGFLCQSRISDRNVARLRVLAGSGDASVARLATLVLEVAEEAPYRRRRLRLLARERRDLLERLRETGLIAAHGW